MNDERHYSIFTGWVTLGVLLLVALKLLAMHGLPLSHNENWKDFATNSPSRGNANELDDEMSEVEPLRAGELMEPIVFEPKRKIGLGGSTYKVSGCMDFRPYQDSFKKFEMYIHRFSRDLWDPDCIGALVDMYGGEGEDCEYIQKRGEACFGLAACGDVACNCGVGKQCVHIIYETNKLKELFGRIHEKFLKAINHMEFHPTLGRERRGTSYRLHKHDIEGMDAGMAHQVKCLSPDDVEMLGQGNEIVQKRYLRVNSMGYQAERFDLAAWILGWGVYSNAHNIISIKKNIRALCDQSVLRER